MSDSLTAMRGTLADLGIGEELIALADWTLLAESPPELHEMGETSRPSTITSHAC